MSAPQILAHAMKMLTAPTLLVLITVFVNRDSLEMGQFVKVRERFEKINVGKPSSSKLIPEVLFDYFILQISTSVLQIPTLVAKKLIVQTPTDLSGARVKTVLMEMDRNAKVHNVVKTCLCVTTYLVQTLRFYQKDEDDCEDEIF